MEILQMNVEQGQSRAGAAHCQQGTSVPRITTSTTKTEQAGEARTRDERARSLPKLVRAAGKGRMHPHVEAGE